MWHWYYTCMGACLPERLQKLLLHAYGIILLLVEIFFTPEKWGNSMQNVLFILNQVIASSLPRLLTWCVDNYSTSLLQIQL